MLNRATDPSSRDKLQAEMRAMEGSKNDLEITQALLIDKFQQARASCLRGARPPCARSPFHAKVPAITVGAQAKAENQRLLDHLEGFKTRFASASTDFDVSWRAPAANGDG